MRPRPPPRLRLQPRRPRGRPKAEDVEALESRLIDVARQAFIANGYGATSINAIAKAARVSKNTLYARFPSKGALFRVIVADQIAGVDQELGPGESSHNEALEDQLRAYVRVATRRSLGKEVLEINRLIMSESFQFPELGEAAHARFRIGVEHIARIIEDFAARDRIPCRNATAAAEVFMYSVYGWYNMIIVGNRTVTDREQSAWINSVVGVFMASRAAW